MLTVAAILNTPPTRGTLAFWLCVNENCDRIQWLGPTKDCPTCGHDGAEQADTAELVDHV